MSYEIYNEDCLEGMKSLEDDSVDMILCDLPYNLTDCAWDKGVIDLPTMWTQFKRILKPCCSAVMFASGKFTHKLIASNFEQYKYKWIWVKNVPTMFVQAKNAPMRKFEEILVFSDGVINHASVSKRRMKYNPQGLVPCNVPRSNDGKDTPSQLRAGGRGEKWNGFRVVYADCASGMRHCERGKLKGNSHHECYGDRPSRPAKVKTGANATKTQIHNPHPENFYIQEQTNYPVDVLEEKDWRKNYNWSRHNCKGRFGGAYGARPSHVDDLIQEQTGYPNDVLYYSAPASVTKFHPTQKPVDLLEYLIKTYTNEGELVLDATMGSGSTGVATMNTGRRFIGFESEEKFYDIAKKRIDEAIAQREQSLFKLEA